MTIGATMRLGKTRKKVWLLVAGLSVSLTILTLAIVTATSYSQNVSIGSGEKRVSFKTRVLRSGEMPPQTSKTRSTISDVEHDRRRTRLLRNTFRSQAPNPSYSNRLKTALQKEWAAYNAAVPTLSRVKSLTCRGKMCEIQVWMDKSEERRLTKHLAAGRVFFRPDFPEKKCGFHSIPQRDRILTLFLLCHDAVSQRIR